MNSAMPLKFIARSSGTDDENDVLVAGLAEGADGSGRVLFFEAGADDSYCLATEGPGTAYGCVRELTIDGDRLAIVVRDEAVATLGLGDPSILVQLAVDAQSVAALRHHLVRILSHGHADDRPAVLRL